MGDTDTRLEIQPGVGPVTPGHNQPVYHGFYQWVGMVLFGQSIIFYIPHFLWKSCEGKRIERLISGENFNTKPHADN